MQSWSCATVRGSIIYDDKKILISVYSNVDFQKYMQFLDSNLWSFAPKDVEKPFIFKDGMPLTSCHSS